MYRLEAREVDKPEGCEKVQQGTGRVSWGEDNLYPQFLVGLHDDNPIHGGILNQKVTFITAGGITIEGDTDGQALNNSDSSPLSLDEVMDDITWDAEYFNGTSILFKKDPSGYWFALPIDFELVRATEDGIWYEISDDWSTAQQSEEKTNWRRVKSIHNREEADEELILYNISKPKQKYHGEGRKKKLTLSYYPVPTYSGGITSIMAGCEMDWFTLSEIVNGYQGGTLINLANGIPESEDAEKKIVNRIKADATDKKKKGGLTITFSDGKEREPRVSQLSGNDLDKRYIESGREVSRKIMIAHQVISPALFSVMSETLFGSKEELETAYILFRENYVKKRQKFISKPLEWALNTLNGTNIKITYNDYQLPFTISSTAPTTEPAKMSSDKDPIIEAFEKAGVDRKSVEILKSDVFDCVRSDEEFISTFQTFAIDLNKDQEAIVQMIKDGKSYNQIANEFGKGGIWLSNQLVELGRIGVLDGWEINENVIDKPEYKVLYSYEVKAGLGSAVIPTSREFCITLVQMDKLYTRQEIDQISSAVDRDVWRYRGGWYHNPKTDTTTPSCRHEWKQNIVKV